MTEPEKSLIERPSFLPPSTSSSKTVGLELVGGYYSPSFFKIIQKMSSAPFKPPFNEGDVITVPNMTKVISPGEKFFFVPVFAYPEWTIHNPVGVKPFIVERTLDINTDLAKHCKSREKDVREYPCPQEPKKMCKYMEHLNFVVILENNQDLGFSPVVMTMCSTEWKRGVAFINLMRARRVEAIYGCRFQAGVSMRKNTEGEWFGFDIINPEDGKPYIQDEALFREYENVHLKLRSTFEDTGIQVDYEAGSPEDDANTIDAKY